MTIRTKLDAWCNAVIEAGWLAALIVAPLFFNVFSSRVFEPDKISLVRTIALVMLLAWLVKLANGGRGWLPPATDGTQANDDTIGSTGGRQTSVSSFWRIPFVLPTLLLILAYLVSTLFSVAPFVSWFGSYQRLQGTYSFLSYIIIAALTAAHLRHPDQIRRLQHVIVITSLPVAIYGVIQHYGIDPLPWGGDVSRRVAANAGNAIFLAAYLIMAFFFTLERVYSTFAYLLSDRTADGDGEPEPDMPVAFAGGAYLFVLMVQLLAIFWTQSRGPWLGLLLGLYVFVLLLFTVLRPRAYRLFTAGWIGLGVAGVAILVLLNVTPLGEPLRDIPYVGRLTTMLESESGTGRVRVLIWEGASEMVQPHDPLIFPDGSRDAVNPLRPLVGYGPEAMWIAYNPFYPPQLAQVEARNASPDRSHNETWDALVITGVAGFVAYLLLFVSIFYWALRWLGLLINRRDSLLFGGLMTIFSLAAIIAFYIYDDGWRFFGVALPAGMMAGLGVYVTISAFLHPDLQPARADIPRQLLLITLLTTIIAHFVEIHFGIAIAATRTYFWVMTAMLLVLGLRWLQPLPMGGAVAATAEETATANQTGKRRPQRRNRRAATNAGRGLPLVPDVVMTDLLMFFTLIFVYTTNSQGLTNAWAILMNSVTKRPESGGFVNSPAIFFLLAFTWLVAATVGLTGRAVQQRSTPGVGWWLRGYAVHAVIVWGGWLAYGLLQSRRLIPGVTGNELDAQLDLVAGHFALFTWLVVAWILAAGVVLAWYALRDGQLAAARRWILAAAAGLVVLIVTFAIIGNVNIALVRADIIYKQGQQFDAQGNWVSSVELYRRALAARSTEDHYMLFLGRSLLEQAKQAPVDGITVLPADPTVGDVLNLTPAQVNQMSRLDLLRAAEAVLLRAQEVNPLNTDHTANLARLYRTWADMMTNEPEMRSAMLGRSIAEYEMAVQLSPNAAHLWNEKGNAHLARQEPEQAEAAFLQSLELDDRFEQTYLLLADFYERQGELEKAAALLIDSTTKLRSAQIQSYLSVLLARTGDLQGSVEANMRVLEMQPNNAGAMRNLAVLYRDLGDPAEAVRWAQQTLATMALDRADERLQMHQMLVELYTDLGDDDGVLAQYEAMRELAPENPTVLKNLYNRYRDRELWDQAVDVLRILVAVEPDDYRHPLAMAQILQNAGQPENALPFAERALGLAPDAEKPAIQALVQELDQSS